MQISKAEQERLEILRLYRKLIDVWHTRKETKDRWEVRKAFRLAADYHKDKRRKSGEPFIIHPLEVAIIAAGEIGLGRTSIIAALLHDTVEDTELELKDIEALFDKKVANIIDGLTKIDYIEESGVTPQAATLRKIIMSLSDDIRVILVKLADRLHNMRTLDAMRPEQQLRTASESLTIYAPIAHRLGLYAIKTELEELSFKYTEPDSYRGVKNRLDELKENREKYLERVIPKLKESVSAIFPENEIIVNERSAYSVWKKLKDKKIFLQDCDGTFTIDIVVDNGETDEGQACWQTYSAVSKVFKPDNLHLKDLISIPKENGYQAIHTKLLGPEGRWLEVHIRSKRMHEVSKRGYAAFYELNELLDKEHNINIWLEKTKELQEKEDENAALFLEKFTHEFLTDEVMVITPKGDLIKLPKGSTILDFAYHIHSDLGNHCMAGNVNRQLKEKSYVLKPGDKVEIITSDKAEPTEEWFNFATTAKAEKGISNYIHNKRKKYHSEGAEKLKEICNQLKIEYSKAVIAKLIDHYNYQGKVDLFYFVATGAITAKHVKEVLFPDDEKRSWYSYLNIFRAKNNSSELKKEKETGNIPFSKIARSYKGDLKQLDHVISKCCNPLPGDEIIGISIPGQPIQIHRTDCNVGHKLMSIYGKSIIKVQWKEDDNLAFLAGLSLEAEDKQGLMLELAKLFSEKYNINFRSFKMTAKDGITEAKITFFISSEKKLEGLKSSIKKIKAIKSVERITDIQRI